MKPPLCFAPWNGSTPANAKFDPKPIDEAKLAKDEAAIASVPEKAYARARAYFEARHWAEAGQAFRAVAFEHSNDGVGIYAGQLYLECLNILGSQAQRPECYDDMARDVPLLRDLYCGARRAQNGDACDTLDLVEMDIERLAAQQLVEESDRNPADTTGYHAGAERYASALRAYCLQSTPRAHCDEIAYNAASAYIAAGDLAAATTVRALMIDPRNKMSASPLTKRLICKLDGPLSPSCH